MLAGLAVGIQLAQLPWKVLGVMLAGPLSYYQQQQTALTALFADKYLAGEQLCYIILLAPFGCQLEHSLRCHIWGTCMLLFLPHISE